jgi:hypothetical protein
MNRKQRRIANSGRSKQHNEAPAYRHPGGEAAPKGPNSADTEGLLRMNRQMVAEDKILHLGPNGGPAGPENRAKLERIAATGKPETLFVKNIAERELTKDEEKTLTDLCCRIARETGDAKPGSPEIPQIVAATTLIYSYVIQKTGGSKADQVMRQKMGRWMSAIRKHHNIPNRQRITVADLDAILARTDLTAEERRLMTEQRAVRAEEDGIPANGQMPVVEPEKPFDPAYIGVTVIFGSATLRGGLPRDYLPRCLGVINKTPGSRQAARSYVVNMFKAGQHLDKETGQAMLTAALGIALTSEGMGEILQMQAEKVPGFGITYEITPLPGVDNYNWRLMTSIGDRITTIGDNTEGATVAPPQGNTPPPRPSAKLRDERLSDKVIRQYPKGQFAQKIRRAEKFYFDETTTRKVLLGLTTIPPEILVEEIPHYAILPFPLCWFEWNYDENIFTEHSRLFI